MGTEKFQPFPNNVIYNVYIECDETSYISIRDNPFIPDISGINSRNDAVINCPFINIITPNEEFITSGTLRLVGYGSRLYKKLSWLIKLDKKFMGRKSIKLRAVANDPTLMRDKISNSLLKAVGVPVQEGSYARVNINNDVWGLYSFVDTLNPKWVKAYIHGDDKYKVGNAYKMFSSHPVGPYASFEYFGDDFNLYPNYIIDIEENENENENENNENNEIVNDDVNDNEDKGNTAENFGTMLKFIKLFNEWKTKYQNDFNSEEAFKELDSFLNVEMTLRIVAVETLIMATDNFAAYQTNAAIYYNPEQKKYQFLPYDYDESLKGEFSEYFPENALNDCINWYITSDYTSGENFIQTLLRYNSIYDRYLTILAKTSRTVFDSETLFSYIDAIANLIRDDVEWNFNLIEQYATTYSGLSNKYTIQNFEGNLNYDLVPYEENVIVNDYPYGLKQFIEMRGGLCQKITADVDISSSSNHNFSSKITLLLIFSQIIIFFLF